MELLDRVTEGAFKLLSADQDWNDFGLETHFVEAVEVQVLQTELHVSAQLHPVLPAVVLEVLKKRSRVVCKELLNVWFVHKGRHVSSKLALSMALTLLVLQFYLLFEILDLLFLF